MFITILCLKLKYLYLLSESLTIFFSFFRFQNFNSSRQNTFICSSNNNYKTSNTTLFRLKCTKKNPKI